MITNPTSLYPQGWRNLIHNGAMEVSQRGGASIAQGAGVSAFLVDRWQVFGSGVGNTGTFSGVVQDTTTPPPGFSHSLKVTVGTADAALGTTHAYEVVQGLEGLDVARLGWGTASPKPVTLSFWVRSSVTGTFAGAVRGSTGLLSYVFTYSIPVANTWTFIIITVPGTATAVFAAYDTTQQLSLAFSLGLGSNFNTATPFTWLSGGPWIATTTSVNLIATAGATWAITGVQLEEGSLATPFEWRNQPAELAMCQRYYYNTAGGVGSGTQPLVGNGICSTTSNANVMVPFKQTMRGAPGTVAFNAVFANTLFYVSDGITNTAITACAILAGQCSAQHGFIACTTGATLTAFRPVVMYGQAGTSWVSFSAEI